MQLYTNTIRNILDNSLVEDLGINGDITSNILIAEDKKIKFTISAREDLIICGTNIAQYFFDQYSNIQYNIQIQDSKKVQKENVIISGYGRALEILKLERVILNYMQKLSGIATLTNKYVLETIGTKVKICDTRKTTPNLRILEKYAIRCGGGHNHRPCLDSSILIKDNHIAICGSVKLALDKAKLFAPHYAKIEIECDTLTQVEEAIKEGVDIIMLDNMTINEIKEAVKIINKKAIIEVSGGMTIEKISDIAKTGIDIISVGSLTHSSKAIDIGLDI